LVWQLLGIIAWELQPAFRFFIAALCGGALLLLLAEPQGVRIGRIIVLGAALGLLWGIGAAEPLAALRAHPALLGAFLGLGAMADFALHPAKDGGVTLAGFGIPAFVFVVALSLVPMGRGWLVTRDAVLLLADRSLGGLPSYAVAEAFAAFRPLAALSWAAYLTLPVEAALVVLVALRRGRPDMNSRRILLACGVAGLAGVLGYWICPAAGPRYAFPEFPARPVAVSLTGMTVAPGFPRNAMPSLHFAWAWMLHRAARPVPWLRWATLAWLAGIVMAALGFGEHYLIDLVVAVPFVAAIEAGIARERTRLLVAGTIVAAWVLFLGNDGGMTPLPAWASVAATLGAGIWALPGSVYAASDASEPER